MNRNNLENVTYSAQASGCESTRVDNEADQGTRGLKGAEILVSCLVQAGVEVVFGYPGGANLEIIDVLERMKMAFVRVEHEQAAVHAAQGYARTTGRIGVCLATSGPGATNLVTGIADANSDSIPILAVTGNVPTHLLGRNAFQEVDIVSIVKPITKGAYLIKQVEHISGVVDEAISLAISGRPGPVLIDIPKDIQQQYLPYSDEAHPTLKSAADTRQLQPSTRGLSRDQIAECAAMISSSKRPILYVGGGIVSAHAETELLQFSERIKAPVVTTIMGVGAFPSSHELCLDVLGMHGAAYANIAINEADLVIALGVRFDDRVTGNVQEFIKKAQCIHIDVDEHELNKNKQVALPIHADVRTALRQLSNVCGGETRAWRRYCAELKEAFPYPVASGSAISPQRIIAHLCQRVQGDAIVTMGVGQHQMWAMQHFRPTKTRSFLSSSGFGTMGYGLPAAIGAKTACPNRIVIDIDGDGSLNMTVQELATCRRHGVGVKVVVINNQWLGMVRQWQDMIYAGNRAASTMADSVSPTAVEERAEVYPDFVKIAEGYRINAGRVRTWEEVDAALDRMLLDPDEPYLLDVIVESEANVYPMIPAGGTYRDIIMSDESLSPNKMFNQGSNI